MMNRRQLLSGLAATTAIASPLAAMAQQSSVLTKPVPSSGEALPLVGLGSWITFNVGDDPSARDACAEVMAAFFAGGGRMIDSSPMYGSAQDVIGYGLEKLGRPKALFSADKVWTWSDGPDQIEESRHLWGIESFDLLQIHNLLSWEEHLPVLRAMKEQGKLRYIGITTSEGRRHDEFIAIMRNEPLDFIQVTYNIVDREIESVILPMAAERRMAVIVNRPFQQGALIAALEGHPLPPWAADLACTTWAQFILKFIISHPAVTCAIPATSNVAHVRENMAAAQGPLPDIATRDRMIAYVENL
jgi:diketogulonate reductase-like aldo/keto reductase